MSAPKINLASASPRRRELLALLGLPFRQLAPPAAAEPSLPSDKFEAWVESAARAKALAVASGLSSGLTVGADTIVIHEGRALGKPISPAEAWMMLLSLRGKDHQVITGLAVSDVNSGRTVSSHTITTVWMRSYSDEEISRYVASKDPLDKAGAYAIQNVTFHPAERIEGCYYNVVGLPLLAVVQALAELGYDIRSETRATIPGECRGCPTGAAFS